MVRHKIKIWAFFKASLIIVSLSSMVIMVSSSSVAALSLDKTVAISATAPGIDCSVDFNPITWLICPLISGLSAVVEGFDTYITSALTVNPCTYFDAKQATDPFCDNSKQSAAQSSGSEGFYTAWSAFRDLALGIMVIGALIMVLSQILGFEVLDAYTIRKVLPRIVIAAIGISLSWQLMQFLIQLSNDLGNGISYLIYNPFAGGVIQTKGVVITNGVSSAGAVLGFGAIATMGIMASLSFVVVALVAAFLGFAVVVLRQILIIFLAILSPIAIAMFILPNTEKVWKLWWNTFFKALIMFPLIIGMIDIGRIFAAISSQNGGNIGQFIAFVAYFGPYFIIPQTFKFAGGILAAGGGAASKARSSFGKAAGGYRGKKRKEIHEKRQAGDTRLSSGRSGNVYRRMTTAGGLSPFGKGQARYKANSQLRTQSMAAESLKRDGGQAAGDDIATGLALQSGMTGGTFLTEYAKAYTASSLARDGTVVSPEQAQTQARSALATIQTNFGTRLGTPGMQAAAAQAHFNSVTAYPPTDAGLAQMVKDGRGLVQSGAMTADAVTRSIKSNKARPDFSAAGFGDILSAVQGTGRPEDAVAKLRESAINGIGPAELIGAHKNAIDALAPGMADKAQRLYNSKDPKHVDEFNKTMASFDNIYSQLSTTSPKMAEAFYAGVLGKNLQEEKDAAGNITASLTIRQAMEAARDTEGYKNMRGSMGPMPSDIRLKYNISFVGVQNGYRLYSFNYKFDRTTYVGVMAQEILLQKPEAVIRQKNGYYSVDYRTLGLKMYSLEEWKKLKTTVSKVLK